MTLNNLKQILTSFFESHSMINTVLFGDDWKLNSERKNIYPLVNIEYINSQFNNKFMSHNFRIVVCDLMDIGTDNQVDEIFSDSLQIADDFSSFIQEQEGIVWNRSGQINKLIDDTGDRVAGVYFNISLNVMRSMNECQIPINE